MRKRTPGDPTKISEAIRAAMSTNVEVKQPEAKKATEEQEAAASKAYPAKMHEYYTAAEHEDSIKKALAAGKATKEDLLAAQKAAEEAYAEWMKTFHALPFGEDLKKREVAQETKTPDQALPIAPLPHELAVQRGMEPMVLQEHNLEDKKSEILRANYDKAVERMNAKKAEDAKNPTVDTVEDWQWTAPSDYGHKETPKQEKPPEIVTKEKLAAAHEAYKKLADAYANHEPGVTLEQVQEAANVSGEIAKEFRAQEKVEQKTAAQDKKPKENPEKNPDPTNPFAKDLAAAHAQYEKLSAAYANHEPGVTLKDVQEAAKVSEGLHKEIKAYEQAEKEAHKFNERLDRIAQEQEVQIEAANPWIVDKYRKTGEWYKGLSWKKKLLVTGVLVAGAAGASVIGSAAASLSLAALGLQRIASSAAVSLAADAALQRATEKKYGTVRTKAERDRHAMEAIALGFLFGVGGVGHVFHEGMQTDIGKSLKVGAEKGVLDPLKASAQAIKGLFTGDSIEAAQGIKVAPALAPVVSTPEKIPGGITQSTTPVETKIATGGIPVAPQATPEAPTGAVTTPHESTLSEKILKTTTSPVANVETPETPVGTGSVLAPETTQTPAPEAITTTQVTVQKGDTLWKLIGNKLESNKAFTALSPEQRTFAIDSLVKEKFSGNTLSSLSIGQKIDLSGLNDSKFLEETFAKAHNLSAAQLTNIEHYQAPTQGGSLESKLFVDSRPSAQLIDLSNTGPEASTAAIAPEVKPQIMSEAERIQFNSDVRKDFTEHTDEMYKEKKGFFGRLFGRPDTPGAASEHWTGRYGFANKPAQDILYGTPSKVPGPDIGINNMEKFRLTQDTLKNIASLIGAPTPTETVDAYLHRGLEQAHLQNLSVASPVSNIPEVASAPEVSTPETAHVTPEVVPTAEVVTLETTPVVPEVASGATPVQETPAASMATLETETPVVEHASEVAPKTIVNTTNFGSPELQKGFLSRHVYFDKTDGTFSVMGREVVLDHSGGKIPTTEIKVSVMDTRSYNGSITKDAVVIDSYKADGTVDRTIIGDQQTHYVITRENMDALLKPQVVPTESAPRITVEAGAPATMETPVSPERLTEAHERVAAHLNFLQDKALTVSGRFETHYGTATADWNDREFGFKNQPVEKIFDAESHPNPDVKPGMGTGTLSREQTKLMADYLRSAIESSGLKPVPQETVNDFLTRIELRSVK